MAVLLRWIQFSLGVILLTVILFTFETNPLSTSLSLKMSRPHPFPPKKTSNSSAEDIMLSSNYVGNETIDFPHEVLRGVYGAG